MARLLKIRCGRHGSDSAPGCEGPESATERDASQQLLPWTNPERLVEACYLIFYRLDPIPAYWIGMVPLAVDGVVAAILAAIVTLTRVP